MSPARALEYATFLKKHSKRSKTPIKNPAVIGAIINLGFCLDLIEYSDLQALKHVNNLFELYTGYELLQNRNVGNNKDLLLRERDCFVIEMLHNLRHRNNLTPYDSVRSVFWEGPLLYENAGFREKDHIQLCIRNPNCIKGYFLPREFNEKFRVV